MTGDGTFHVRVETSDAGAVVTAAGDVDMLSGAEFTAALREAVLGASGPVRLDLSAVTYLGSEGVQALVATDRLAHDRGVRLSMTPSAIVARALEASSLADLIGR
jgi:anti-anti-sigma factor